MNSIDTGPLYAKIAGLAVENAQSINENILLYIEIEEGVIGGAIFKEVGDKIYYYQCGTELIEATYELWNLLPDTDRWSIMNMDITNGAFDAKFEFPENWSMFEEGDDPGERQDRAAIARFGKKEIVDGPVSRDVGSDPD